MNKQSTKVVRIATTIDKLFIEVVVRYQKGIAYFVHVSPIVVEQHDGYETSTWIGFTGGKAKLEMANRFSDKKLQTLAADVLSNPDVATIIYVTMNEGHQGVKFDLADADYTLDSSGEQPKLIRKAA